MRAHCLLFIATAATLRGAEPVDRPAQAREIVAEASAKLLKDLMAAIAADGPAGAIRVCSEKAPAIAAEVGKAHGVTIRRASTRNRNPANQANQEEQAVLLTFAKALASKEPPKPQWVPAEDGSATFFSPILLASPVCLQCHGTPHRDIAPETLATLRKTYPDDLATGYSVGELRGLWRLAFPSPD